jgi:two-component system response regulator YesN
MKEKYYFLFTMQTFRKLLASYAILLILPVLFGSLVYFTVINVITQGISNANQASLLQTKRLVDAKLSEFYSIADQLSINDSVLRISSAKEDITPNQRIVMTDVQKLLQQYKLVNSFVDQIYIYFPNSNYVLSNVSRYHGDDFEYITDSVFNMTMQEWKAYVLSDDYSALKMLNTGDQNDPVTFVYVKKVFYSGIYGNPAVVVILADRGKVARMLDMLKWNDSSALMILANDGNISRLGVGSFPPPPDYQMLKDNSETMKYRGISFYISNVSSSVSSWKYTVMIPLNHYTDSANRVSWLILMYVVLCILGGLVISFVMAKRNYSPIHHLTRILLDRLGKVDNSERNDIKFLEKSLQLLLQENANMSSTIHNQKASVRNGLFKKLLRGNITHMNVLLESCEACGIQFLSDSFLLMTMIIDEENSPFFDQPVAVNAEATETEDLIQFMIQSVLEELLGKNHAGYVTEYNDTILCIVSLSPETEDSANRKDTVEGIVAVAERMRLLFNERFGIKLSVAVSSVYDSFSALPKAMKEVGKIVETMILYGDSAGTRTVENSLLEKSHEANESLMLIRDIITAIKMEDYDAVRDKVDNYMKTELMGKDVPLTVAKLRMSGLVGIIVDALLELRPVASDELLADLDLEKLERIKSIKDYQKEIMHILERLNIYYKARQKQTPTMLTEEIMKYVEGHYADKDLSVSSIADKFNVSLAHLSRLFKKETGTGLLDYIHLCRVREAINLIKNCNSNIQDIAERVGYSSSISLVRAFKRHVGMIPSDFRDSLLDKN